MKQKIRTRIKIFLFACLLVATTFVLPTLSYSGTYYVSTNGNDGNPGSLTSPFRTIKFALGRLIAGDTLLIRGGTYSEKLESHNGTNFPSGNSWENPVLISAFSGEAVTLAGKISIGIETPTTQYVIFDGIIIDATGQDTGISINGGAHHLRFINGEVKNSGGTSGITTTYTNDSNPSNTYHEFINMNIHHNGITKNLDHGFYVKTSGNLIEYCRIHDNAAWGIVNYVLDGDPRANNNIYRNNLLYNNGNILGSGGGISISRGDNNSIYNNVVWGNENGIKVNNIGNPREAKVYNNTVYKNKARGIDVFPGAVDTKVINNISFNNSIDIFNDGTNTILSKNLTVDPNFVDSANGDFHLFETSLAINNGMPLEEVKTDMAGLQRPLVAPSIGAYEYNAQLAGEPPKNLRFVTN